MGYGQKHERSSKHGKYGQKSLGRRVYGGKFVEVGGKRGLAAVGDMGSEPKPTKMAHHEIGNFGMTHKSHW